MSEPGPVLDGLWQMIRAEFEGELAPELVTTKTTLELVEGSYRVWFDGVVSDQGSFALGRAGEDSTIVLCSTGGQNAGRTIPAIYQQVGDRLRVCYGLDGAVPVEFRAESGASRYLATYRRRPR